ncbi:MAG: hypothetical protein WDN69_37235 [Aliidongia sp.]
MTLPPLRERAEDIELLAEHMALQMTQELKRDVFSGFTPRALQALQEYDWPGNVRELKNVVERAVYRTTDPDQAIDEIVFDPFRLALAPARRAPTAEPAGTKSVPPALPHPHRLRWPRRMALTISSITFGVSSTTC